MYVHVRRYVYANVINYAYMLMHAAGIYVHMSKYVHTYQPTTVLTNIPQILSLIISFDVL